MSDSESKVIELPGMISVRDLAQLVSASPIQVIKILMSNGVMASINQTVDFETAAVVLSEMGFEARQESMAEEKVEETGEVPLWRQLIADENPKSLIGRAPVVTILGHVDHGKTTLLDAIRNTDVAGGEAGGITQHIGAYQIEHKGRPITFLDTPGHAAFTAMRARGAQGADVVVLVVAADDGVMPQTKEAIAHAKAARVPIVVAMNKMDRPNANPDFVKKQLADSGLVPDDWDGNTIVVPVSAKQKQGLEDLLEAILLVTDSLDIRANPAGKVIGTVIEAQVDRAKGVMATFLVQNGTLEMGDAVAAGKVYGRLRAMFDYKGRAVRKAGPSTPVRVMGLNDVPEAGDTFRVYASEKEARQVVSDLKTANQQEAATAPKATLESLFEAFKAGETKELRLIVKADVQGSLEPIVNSLKDIKSEEIKINVLHSGTGDITESDIMLATASKAIVVGFNVSADTGSRHLAETEGVSIRLYEIIYRLIEDVEKALKGMLEPEYKPVVTGQAQVLAVFKITKVGNVAGCKVIKGEIRRNGKVRVLRDSKVLFEGEIQALKHEKDDVKEVRLGYECGISLRGFNDIEEGDILEGYVIEQVGG
ncbi:MAG TPA: translation initiation factor IF-2 [Longilinea sp.]|nr:translation initiation factor IF-2 [Longilinea sp.]